MINVLHTALLVFTILVFQFFYDQYYLLGILCVIWAFMFWQFLLVFYAQIQFLHDPERRSRKRSLPNTLLRQAHKKNQFKASMKALRVWDYRLALWFLCGCCILFITYFNSPAGGDVEGLNIDFQPIKDFFEPIKNIDNVNFAPGLSQKFMLLAVLLIMGIGFFTTILRVNQNRHNQFLYSFCGIIFLSQLAFIIFYNYGIFTEGIGLRSLNLKDAFVIVLGIIALSELSKGVFKKASHMHLVGGAVSILFVMMFFFVQNIQVPELNALYFSGWIILGILWGKKQSQSIRRQVMHQV